MNPYALPKIPGFARSFALISVLALVSLAALTATAFLATARLESRANMSLLNTTRLEMALNAAACAAAEMVDYAPSESFNFVTTYWRGTNENDWTNELGYLLSGAVPNTSAKTSTELRFQCCFSTATFTNLSNSASALVRITNPVTNQGSFKSQMGAFMADMTNFAAGQSVTIPLLGDTPTNRYLSPPVGWVYIRQDVRLNPGSTNTTNIPVVRFAFYVQDLAGLIDAQRMGGVFSRDSGTNPEEISLTNAGGTSLTNSPIATNFVSASNRWKYLSPGLLANSNGGRLTTNDLRYVTTGLLQWTNAWARIPIGLGYANSGDFKISLATNTNTMTSLASFLRSNLTNFASRSGAMNSNAYIDNIAANIVDYLDTDSTPTTDNANDPSYLGIENLPWPNELFDRVLFDSVTSSGLVRVQHKDWIEVWNMGNQAISNSPTLTLSNNLDLILTFSNTFSGSVIRTNLNQMTFESGSLGNRDFALTSTLDSNNYVVLESSTDPATRRLAFQLTNPALYSTAAIRGAWRMRIESNTLATNSTNMTFTAFFSNTVIQKSRGGIWQHWSSFLQPGLGGASSHYLSVPVGFGSQTTLEGAPQFSGGDPRAQLFLSGATRKHNYTNKFSTPGGRNIERYFTGQFQDSGEVNPKRYWPDQGHCLGTNGSDLGGNPTTPSQNPTQVTNGVVPFPDGWVMKRNDSGGLTNILELGNIFDPLQWQDQNASEAANQPGLWTNLTANATASDRFGGRNTLRIGRWEFSRFAFTNQGTNSLASPDMMTSAAGLLDLFCLTNQQDEGGRINLNTAPAPVLRALAGGIQLTNDPGQNPKNHPVPAELAEAFAQGVMRFRSQYPFYSPSQLVFIGTSSNWPNTTTWPDQAVFGNTNPISLATAPGNTFGTANLGVTEWNDSAAEEWFSKIYHLATTQSRNFRCYAIAQLVDAKTNPIGPVARKYYHLITRNNTDAQTDSRTNVSCSTYHVYESPY